MANNVNDVQANGAYLSVLATSGQATVLPDNYNSMDSHDRETVLFMLVAECLERIADLETP